MSLITTSQTQLCGMSDWGMLQILVCSSLTLPGLPAGPPDLWDELYAPELILEPPIAIWLPAGEPHHSVADPIVCSSDHHLKSFSYI